MNAIAACGLPIPCLIVVTDIEGRVLAANEQWQQLGFSSSHHDQPGIGDVLDRALSPASAMLLHTHVRPMLLREGRVREVFLQLRRADGTDVPVMLNAQWHAAPEARGVWVFFETRHRSQFEAALVARARHAQEQTRRLSAQAVRDPLTGLYNRRQLEHALQQWCTHTGTDDRAALILVDIDHFKAFNDRWGHLHGDQVLVAVADALRQSVRASDTVARFGGEEFAIWMPGADATAAHEAAQRMHEAVRSATVGGTTITISIGVATLGAPAAPADLVQLFRAADGALYTAKQRGRDCTVVADSAQP